MGWLATLLLVAWAPAGAGAGAAKSGPALAEIKGELRAVASADVRGDGACELLVLEARDVYRAVLAEGEWDLQPMKVRPAGVDWFGMTAGDVDGDGRDEIALWGFRPQLTGVVLGWDGEALVQESSPLPLYLRIIESGGQAQLYGQRTGADRDFMGEIEHYSIVDGGLERGEPLEEGAGLEILGLFYGGAPGEEAPVMYNFASSGELERRDGAAVVWRSEEIRMTRPLSVERERANLLGERRAEVQAFPTEVAAADVDGDGTAEVLMVTSDQASVPMLERVRVFRGGSYRLLGEGDRGLVSRATSLLMGRLMTGVALLDVDGDGSPEALATVVIKRRSGVSRGLSSIVALDPLTGDLLELGRPVEGTE